MNSQKNYLTLSFNDTALEKEYYDYQFGKSLFLSRFGIATGIFLYAVFALLDTQIVPEWKNEIWFIRFAIVVPYLFFLLVFSFTRYFKKYWQIALTSLAIVGGLGIIAMINISSSLGKELYPTGLMIVIMWSYLFSGLRFIYATLTCILVLVAFSISAFYISPMMLHIYINHMFFLTSAFVMGMFAGYTIENYSRNEFIKNKILAQERQKSEMLLLNILPQSVVDELKHKPGIIAEQHNEASILFADIVNFTKFSADLQPKELIQILNEVFSIFDKLTEKYGLEKIKTVGDAYMVASGIHNERKRHAEVIADFALDIQKELKNYNKEHNQNFSMRIGIHSGKLVAGVIGTKKFAYDVWGDTVNTASRMEAYGLPDKIQISENTCRLLKDKYVIEKRGEIDIKGKGMMMTYILISRNGIHS